MTNSEESNPKYACGVGGLSLFGKVTIIKTLLLPKVTYISSIIPSPVEFIKSFQTIIFNFLWKGPDKIARTAAINSFEYGGLNDPFSRSLIVVCLFHIHFNCILIAKQAFSQGSVKSFRNRLVSMYFSTPAANRCFVILHNFSH